METFVRPLSPAAEAFMRQFPNPRPSWVTKPVLPMRLDHCPMCGAETLAPEHHTADNPLALDEFDDFPWGAVEWIRQWMSLGHAAPLATSLQGARIAVRRGLAVCAVVRTIDGHIIPAPRIAERPIAFLIRHECGVSVAGIPRSTRLVITRDLDLFAADPWDSRQPVAATIAPEAR